MSQICKKAKEIGDPSVTPITILNNICMKKKVLAKYDLLQEGGTLFQYRVTVESEIEGAGFEGFGEGRSKKEAKQNAAQSLLVVLETFGSTLLADTKALDQDKDNEGFPVEEAETIMGNPVGILQELCTKLKYPRPTYEAAGQEGAPHMRQYSIKCKVANRYEQIGKGRSRRFAKKDAARLMCQFILNLPPDLTNPVKPNDEDEKIIASASCSNPANSPQKQCLSMTGHLVDKLKDIKFIPSDPVSFIEDFSKEQGAKAIFIEFEEKSLTGKCQCVVELTFDSPAVLIGEGKTRNEAKREAALDAIRYIRIMAGFDAKAKF